MSTRLNDEHEKAVRETRRKVAEAVSESASRAAKNTSGWQRVVLWVVAAGAAVVAWWYSPGIADQQQPEVEAPPAAVAPVEVGSDDAAE